MTTRHLIDPEILPLFDLITDIDFETESLDAIRDDFATLMLAPDPPAITPRVFQADGPGGPVEILWFDPAPGETNRAALLHIHGGGMVIGSAKLMQHGPAAMAQVTGVPVASVEYRLAPEHPFPAPQEDCYAALQWLASEAQALGVNPARIGVTGESAGGGLAAAVALMARDRGGPALAAQLLTYPMLDHLTGGPECRWSNPSAGEFVWKRSSNRFGWAALRGSYDPVDNRKGWFSPTLAESLAGLPPAWIGTGSLDLFVDENLDYARRLVNAGVPTELHVYPGAIHAFDFVAESRLSQCYWRDLSEAIGRMLA